MTISIACFSAFSALNTPEARLPLNAQPGFVSRRKIRELWFLHEQRGEDRDQGNDRCALNGGDGGGHVLGNGIHCFFLQMNYYLVWTDINTGHLQSQACLRIKFSVL